MPDPKPAAVPLAPDPACGGIVLDMFAGPGGWSTGLRALGLHDIGIEWDPAACRTRVAESHLTIEADVAEVDLTPFRGLVWALLSSPPCQSWSVAGRGGGRPTAFLAALAGKYDRAWREQMHASNAARRAALDTWNATWVAAADTNGWWDPAALDGEPARLTEDGADARTELYGPAPEDPEDDRGALMAEAVRYVDELRPNVLAFEQVPPVLVMWQAMVPWLRDRGYSVWTGIVNAADYGVPQTRRRAVLLARRDGRPAGPPAATHTRLVDAPDDLFGTVLEPWVPMAAALGWQAGPDGTRDWDEHVNDQTGTVLDLDWPLTRPATVVAGRGLVQHPGATANRFNSSTKSRNDGIRVTVAQAAVLQSYPEDYRFGTDTASQASQYLQVGNSVPPVLAAHLFSVLADRPVTLETLALLTARPAAPDVDARVAALPPEVRALLTPTTPTAAEPTAVEQAPTVTATVLAA